MLRARLVPHEWRGDLPDSGGLGLSLPQCTVRVCTDSNSSRVNDGGLSPESRGLSLHLCPSTKPSSCRHPPVEAGGLKRQLLALTV